MVRIDNSALKVAQEGFRILDGNISRSNAPQAHRMDQSISTMYGINGDYFGVRSGYSRATNEYLSKSIREVSTKASQADVISSSLKSLELSLSAGEGKGSRLIESLSHFTSKINRLIGNNDPSMRESFLLHSRDLASTISQSVSKINELRFEADQDLSNGVTIVNNIIQNLFNINKGIAIAGDNGINLHDNRDIELNRLAEYFDINVNFGHNGEALVRTKDGTEIVSASYYAKLNYVPLPSIESMLQKDEIKPITLSYSNSQHEPFNVIDTNLGINKITGGKLEGFITLRDVVLPESQSKLQSFTKTLVDEVNRIYSMGSTFPPKTKIESAKKVSFLDQINLTGKTTIAILDGNGRPVEGNSGKIKPLTIDFDNLAKEGGVGGVLTIKELLTELNSQLSYAPTRERLRLGEILDSSGATIPNKSLLNDIKIRGKSNIENGSFTFDLDLDGNELFGSKVEVLSVSANNAPLPENQLPGMFTLKKGEHLCTNQPITVGGIDAQQTIAIKLRVTGENGVVQEGTANFIVDPVANPEMRNKRIAGAIAPVAGNQMTPGDATHTSFARAKLVDENGVEITNDSGKKGRLVIESISDDCRFVVQEGTSLVEGKGFKHFFEFNNFFGLKKDGTVDVLIQNPEDLSIGTYQISKNSAPVNVKVGNVAASNAMQFNGNPANGQTVTIDGVVYTFVGAPVNPNDVLVDAGSLVNTLQNLVDKINATRSLSSKVLAALNVPPAGLGDTITITAKTRGSSGNGITLATNANLVIQLVLNACLIGGADIDKLVEGDYSEMGNNSKEILALFAGLDRNNVKMDNYEGSIHNCASITIGMISNQVIEAKNSDKVTHEVLKQLDAKLKEEVGINKYDERMKLVELAQYYQANLAVARYYNDLWKDFLNFINRI
jgi:flagellar hook-associated protein FlgK